MDAIRRTVIGSTQILCKRKLAMPPRRLLLVLVVLMAFRAPQTILARNPAVPARDVSPAALALPASAFPSYPTGQVLPNMTVDAAFADSTSNPFAPGSLFHTASYASAGMVGGYFQEDSLVRSPGLEVTYWLASIYPSNGQAQARVEDARTSLRKEPGATEVTPVPGVSSQDSSVFAFTTTVSVGQTQTDAKVSYAVWSEGNVVGELAILVLPASAAASNAGTVANDFAAALKAADATVDAAVGAAATPTLAPTSPPTAAPTSAPTPTATATPIPPTPTPVPAVLHVKVSGTLRANRSQNLRVTVSDPPAAIESTSAADPPVSGATVRLDARSVGIAKVLTKRTNGKGVATFKGVHPLRTGTATLRISKSGFPAVTLRLKVRT